MKKNLLLILFMTVANHLVFSQSTHWVSHRDIQWAVDYEKEKIFIVKTPEELTQLAWLVNVAGKPFGIKQLS